MFLDMENHVCTFLAKNQNAIFKILYIGVPMPLLSVNLWTDGILLGDMRPKSFHGHFMNYCLGEFIQIPW